MRRAHPRAESLTHQLPHGPARIGAWHLQALDSATDRTRGRGGDRGRDGRDRMYPLVRSFQLNLERACLMYDHCSALSDPLDLKVPRQKPDRGIKLLGDLVRALFGGPKGPPEFVPASRTENAQSPQLNGGEDTRVEPGVKRLRATLGIVKIHNVVTDQQNIPPPYRPAAR